MPQDESEDELASMPPTVPQSVGALTVNDTIQTKTTKVTAQSRHFENLVLRPRRIVEEDNNEPYKNAYSHFGTVPPLREDILDYPAIEGLEAAEVWLSLSNDQVEQIIEEYEFMGNMQACEQEYASFATETFLRRQRRFVRTL